MQHLYFCEIPLLIKDYLSTFHLFCNIWCNWIHMWFTCVIFPFTGVSTYLSLRKRFFLIPVWFFQGCFVNIVLRESSHPKQWQINKEPCFNWIEQAWSHWINDLMVNLHQWIKKNIKHHTVCSFSPFFVLTIFKKNDSRIFFTPLMLQLL